MPPDARSEVQGSDGAPEDFRATAARIGQYAHADGPCTCGERRGHAGWLICALSPKAGQNIKAHPREETTDGT